ncbi:MAG: hypothetical protein ACREON_06175 [Gemmatimonadaceae bacterium]
MTRSRAGALRVGCLLGLALIVTVVYFGVNLGAPYLRFYRFRDAVETEARFAHRNSNTVILARLRAAADSLGLPPEAKRIQIRRTPTAIRIGAEYYETVETPFFVRQIHFAPIAVRNF